MCISLSLSLYIYIYIYTTYIARPAEGLRTTVKKCPAEFAGHFLKPCDKHSFFGYLFVAQAGWTRQHERRPGARPIVSLLSVSTTNIITIITTTTTTTTTTGSAKKREDSPGGDRGAAIALVPLVFFFETGVLVFLCFLISSIFRNRRSRLRGSRLLRKAAIAAAARRIEPNRGSPQSSVIALTKTQTNKQQQLPQLNQRNNT